MRTIHHNVDICVVGGGLAGQSFYNPVGIAAMKDGKGVEWLYVADIGNQRIIRIPIPNPA